MNANEVWKEICFLLSENIKPDILEKDYENQVIRAVEKLGWLEYTGEIVRQPEIKIGRKMRIRPDLAISGPDKNTLIVIEVKRPAERLSKEEPSDQLISYMLQTQAKFGLLVGSAIRLFYNGKENPQRKPLLLDRIPFEKGSDEGIAFVSALQRDNFINGRYKSYISRLIKNFVADRNIKKLQETLPTEETKVKIRAFLKDEFSEYGSDVVEGALRDLKIKLSYETEPPPGHKTQPPPKIGEDTKAKTVFDIIKQHPEGISKSNLIQLTGFSKKSVSNIIYKLTRWEKIESIKRGVYHSKTKKASSKRITIKPSGRNGGDSVTGASTGIQKKTMAETVFETIQSEKNGIRVNEIVKATGFKKKSITNMLYKLTKLGAVSSDGKGLYKAINESIPQRKIR